MRTSFLTAIVKLFQLQRKGTTTKKYFSITVRQTRASNMQQFHSIFENVCVRERERERESIIHNLHCFEFSLDQVRVRNDGTHPCQTKASVIHQH